MVLEDRAALETVGGASSLERLCSRFGMPDEFFDFSEDPFEEEHNLADERDKEELDEWREELLAWASRVDAGYSSFPIPSP